MSIILKGIDMPKEGEHIVALIKSNGKCSYWKQDAEYGIYEPMQTFEAIQIPKGHGDIKDVSKLRVSEYDYEGEVGWYTLRAVDIWDIDNAPTILEAEE